jgi:hypothetical protein
VDLIDGMERALHKLRAAKGDSWSGAVVESSAVFSRGVAGLLETVQVETLRPAQASGVKAPEEALMRARRYARRIYIALKAEIDAARAGFTGEFLTPKRGIPDYLHEELVRTLAQNDETLLGPDYPGPLA